VNATRNSSDDGVQNETAQSWPRRTRHQGARRKSRSGADTGVVTAQEEIRWRPLVFRERNTFIARLNTVQLGGGAATPHDTCRVFSVSVDANCVHDPKAKYLWCVCMQMHAALSIDIKELYDTHGHLPIHGPDVQPPIVLERAATVLGHLSSATDLRQPRFSHLVLDILPRLVLLQEFFATGNHSAAFDWCQPGDDDVVASLPVLVPAATSVGDGGITGAALRLLLPPAPMFNRTAPENNCIVQLVPESYAPSARYVVKDLFMAEWTPVRSDRRPYQKVGWPPRHALQLLRKTAWFAVRQLHANAATDSDLDISPGSWDGMERDIDLVLDTANESQRLKVVYVQSSPGEERLPLLNEQGLVELIHQTIHSPSSDKDHSRSLDVMRLDMNFAERVALARAADVLVGAHSDALASAAFCRKGTALVEIARKDPLFRQFSHLAAALDLQYFAFADAVANNASMGVEIPAQPFAQMLRQVLHLPPPPPSSDISVPVAEDGSIDLNDLAAMLSAQMGAPVTIGGDEANEADNKGPAHKSTELAGAVLQHLPEDTCALGWTGVDCLECAAGFSGERCEPDFMDGDPENLLLLADRSESSKEAGKEEARKPMSNGDFTPQGVEMGNRGEYLHQQDSFSQEEEEEEEEEEQEEEEEEEEEEEWEDEKSEAVAATMWALAIDKIAANRPHKNEPDSHFVESKASDRHVEIETTASVEEYLMDSRELVASLLVSSEAESVGPTNIGCMTNGIYASVPHGASGRLVTNAELVSIGRKSFEDDHTPSVRVPTQSVSTGFVSHSAGWQSELAIKVECLTSDQTGACPTLFAPSVEACECGGHLFFVPLYHLPG
jgi:hypothetical protein